MYCVRLSTVQLSAFCFILLEWYATHYASFTDFIPSNDLYTYHCYRQTILHVYESGHYITSLIRYMLIENPVYSAEISVQSPDASMASLQFENVNDNTFSIVVTM